MGQGRAEARRGGVFWGGSLFSAGGGGHQLCRSCERWIETEFGSILGAKGRPIVSLPAALPRRHREISRGLERPGLVPHLRRGWTPLRLDAPRALGWRVWQGLRKDFGKGERGEV